MTTIDAFPVDFLPLRTCVDVPADSVERDALLVRRLETPRENLTRNDAMKFQL